ncbi:MAG: hypothetical protein ACRC2T_11265, partial [Thermoguttaceae bacterium]
FLGLSANLNAASIKFGGKKVEADPQKKYVLTEKDGPYMIFVKSFSGPGAEEKASKLALELRKKHNLNSFICSKNFVFDLEAGARPSERNRFKNEKYLKTSAEECAVLVGNYLSMDDLNYEKNLKFLKSLEPDCLKGVMARPLANAFGTTNPLLPSDFFGKKGYVDAFVEKLNSDSKYSLLNCPSKYTIQVATFTGRTEIAQDKVKNILTGKESFGESELEQAGVNAAKLCQALRLKGYEAYEFHDRYSSMVTVGSYNTYGTLNPDQTVAILPEIQKIMDTFKGNFNGRFEPRTLGGIPFDAQPTIILVPRKLSDYQKSITRN